LLLVTFLLVNAPNCHLSLVLASVVQGDAVNCNTCPKQPDLVGNNLSMMMKLTPLWSVGKFLYV